MSKMSNEEIERKIESAIEALRENGGRIGETTDRSLYLLHHEGLGIAYEKKRGVGLLPAAHGVQEEAIWCLSKTDV